MKRIGGAVLAVMVLVVCIGANAELDPYAATLDWGERSILGYLLSLDMGVEKGEDGYPWYDGRPLQGIYDPISNTCFEQPRYNPETGDADFANMPDDTVYLAAVLVDGQHTGFVEIGREIYEAIQVIDRDGLEETYAGFGYVDGEYFGDQVTGMVDQAGGRMHFYNRGNQEPGSGLYLLATYEYGVMTGFEEISRERFLKLMPGSYVSLAGGDVYHWSNVCSSIPEEEREFYFANFGMLGNPDIPPCPVCIPVER